MVYSQPIGHLRRRWISSAWVHRKQKSAAAPVGPSAAETGGVVMQSHDRCFQRPVTSQGDRALRRPRVVGCTSGRGEGLRTLMVATVIVRQNMGSVPVERFLKARHRRHRLRVSPARSPLKSSVNPSGRGAPKRMCPPSSRIGPQATYGRRCFVGPDEEYETSQPQPSAAADSTTRFPSGPSA